MVLVWKTAVEDLPSIEPLLHRLLAQEQIDDEDGITE